MNRALVALAVLAMVVPGPSLEAQQTKVKRDRNLITAQELSELQGHNGYEVVQKLRPDWLRRAERRVTLDARVDRTGNASGRGQGQDNEDMMASPTEDVTAQPLKLTVFVDQTEMGGVEELQRIRNDEIEEMRFLNGSDAQQRYGPRFAAGVIQVRLKTS